MANGNFGGGTGVELDPYLIEDALDLDAVRNDLTAHYKLVANIDLGVSPFNEGAGWTPILSFTGVFDGNTKTIQNLFINRAERYQGLFGKVSGYGVCKNLKLINGNVSATERSGLLVGDYRGTLIENCVVTGDVTITSATHAGGMIGFCAGAVKNCHTNITSTGYASAFIGRYDYATAIIENCYSIGSSEYNGFIGSAGTSGEATNCFYDSEKCVSSSSVGIPKTTSEMQTAQTFIDAGWDINTWSLQDGKYPALWFELVIKSLIKSNSQILTFDNGDFTDTGIATPTQQDFETFGLDDLGVIPQDKITELGSGFEVLSWTDSGNALNLNLITPEFVPFDIFEEQFEVLTWTDKTTAPQTTIDGVKPPVKDVLSYLTTPKVVTWTDSDNDLQLSVEGTVEQKVRFLVSNNNKTTWYTFKNNTWSVVSISNINTEGMTKDELQAITPAQWSNWYVIGTFDIAIGLEGVNVDGVVSNPPSVEKIVVNFPSNEAPLIQNASATPDSIHNTFISLSATLVDQEEDKVCYQVWINGSQAFPSIGGEWTTPVASGQMISKTFDYTNFNVGSNTLMLKAKDTREQISTWSTNIVLTNTEPTVALTHSNFVMEGTIGDPEGDDVCYRVSINNQPFYPSDGSFTPLVSSPYSLFCAWESQDLNFGQLNAIKLEVKDSFDGVYETSFDVMGTYQGLMFIDEDDNYYSSDTGDVLQYLDFGILVAGYESDIKNVRLVNQNYYSVNNLRLDLDKTTVQPYTNIKISKDGGDIFVGKDNLTYNMTLNSGEEINFYVQISTEMLASGGSEFTIDAKSDIVT